jgi:NAD(P)-dependent dehydrogenase (short-subunit alcohol dehydrogenase family)
MELLGCLGLKPGIFDGRIAVVTGAARGIGEQFARGLAHLGAHVVILDILEVGEDTVSQIRGNQRSAEFKQVDLTDLDELGRVYNEIMEEHGHVDNLDDTEWRDLLAAMSKLLKS